MTTLDKDQPYYCKCRIHNSCITTVCDNQCDECKNTFFLTFNQEFKQGASFPLPTGHQCEVVGGVTHINGKWYHKVLHYLTFKQRFVEGYEHKVKLL